MKRYYLIVIISLFLVSLTACRFFDLSNQFKLPEYKRTNNVRFTTFSLSNVTLEADMYMYNPNPIGILLLESNTQIYLNDLLIGSSSQSKIVQINKNSEFKIPLVIQVPSSKITLSFLKSMIGSFKSGNVKMHIKGNCKVQKAGIVLNIPIDDTENIPIIVPKLF
jgi:LEA14-like dessication related protein